MPTLISSFLLVMMAGPAMAHGDDALATGPVWTFDPWIVCPLLALTSLYCVGATKLARRTRRPSSMGNGISLYGAGVLALSAALLSPLHWLGEHALAFHMIEHEIVMVIAAPLMVLSRPIGILLWGLPNNTRRATGLLMHAVPLRRAWDWGTDATNATIVHGIAIWAWHVPLLFDAAVTHVAVHRLQHFSFFATAILFWWAIIWRSDYGSSAWHLFVTMVHTSILGALMALAPRALYLDQSQIVSSWELTPLEDQQLAGMIMWIPAGTIYAAAALGMLALWIRNSSGRKAQNV